MEKKLTYRDAGVDIDAGNMSVSMIKSAVRATYRPEVVGDLGGFGGLFAPDLKGFSEPVLVSGTDGVGTKLKIAFMLDKHDTIGQDAVAMCVNDILVQGAEPLFFLDYLAVGHLKPERVADIVKGVAAACKESGCALIGGETAEMSGFYPEDEYDIAGFAVGVVDKPKIITPERVQEGDVLLGLPSTGVHSNGFSLIRNVFTVNEQNLARHFSDLGTTLGDCLLTPTKIYVNAIQQLLAEVQPKSIAHITGGGFYENIPRALKKGLSAKIDRSDVQVLPIFDLIAKTGKIPEHDMFNTFNMGVGMMVCVAQEDADKAIRILNAAGEHAYVLGELVASDEGVILK